MRHDAREKVARWARIKKFVEAHDLQCLIVFGLKGREHPDHYVTNERLGGAAIFTNDGRVISHAASISDIAAYTESKRRREDVWVEDVRLGAGAERIVQSIKELRLDEADVGVVGLSGGVTVEPEGHVPYATWSKIVEGLPRCRFVDVTAAFMELIMVKSEQELRCVRKAAAAGEKAGRRLVEVTRPGARESKIYSEVIRVLYENSCNGNIGSTVTPLILHSGRDNPSWGAPSWLLRTETPRAIKKGDIVLAEIFPTYAGLETQQQVTVSVRPADPSDRGCYDAAREAYEIGLRTLRPGISFGELAEAMEEPFLSGKYWHLTPLVHSLNPMVCSGPSGVGVERVPSLSAFRWVKSRPTIRGDVKVREGMVFELEPNASVGLRRINIGGTVIATANGAEELNRFSRRMHYA